MQHLVKELDRVLTFSAMARANVPSRWQAISKHHHQPLPKVKQNNGNKLIIVELRTVGSAHKIKTHKDFCFFLWFFPHFFVFPPVRSKLFVCLRLATAAKQWNLASMFLEEVRRTTEVLNMLDRLTTRMEKLTVVFTVRIFVFSANSLCTLVDWSMARRLMSQQIWPNVSNRDTHLHCTNQTTAHQFVWRQKHKRGALGGYRMECGVYFISNIGKLPSGMVLPRTAWVRLDRLHLCVRHFRSYLHE